MSREQEKRVNEEQSATTATGSLPRRLNSGELFKGAREILIEHDGAFYRLRLTGRGKLILTK